jgi:hypothetical protein
VILGRIVQGCGASGIISLASIIITGNIISLFHFFLFRFKKVIPEANLTSSKDIAVPSNVAVLRSYVNIASTVGLSFGGPLGGFLGGTIGWRW